MGPKFRMGLMKRKIGPYGPSPFLSALIPPCNGRLGIKPGVDLVHDYDVPIENWRRNGVDLKGTN